MPLIMSAQANLYGIKPGSLKIQLYTQGKPTGNPMTLSAKRSLKKKMPQPFRSSLEA